MSNCNDWDAAWLEPTAPDRSLDAAPPEPSSNYLIFDTLSLAVLFSAGRAGALADEIKVAGTKLQSIIVLVEPGTAIDGVAALFPNADVEIVQQDRPEDLYAVVRGA